MGRPEFIVAWDGQTVRKVPILFGRGLIRGLQLDVDFEGRQHGIESQSAAVLVEHGIDARVVQVAMCVGAREPSPAPIICK